MAVSYFVIHVDHIIARRHLDEVSDNPDSLAWACSEYNYHKGPNLVSIDPVTRQQTALFNPRIEIWDDHFSIRDGVVIGRTPTGRTTARLLSMNSLRLVRLRRELVEQGKY